MSAHIHPKTASTVMGIAALLLDRFQHLPPYKGRSLVKRFNKAAFQVIRGNFPPMQRLARTLDGT